MKVTTGNHYLAYVLEEEASKSLQTFFPSEHPIKKYHHITIAYDIGEKDIERLQKLVDSDPAFEAVAWQLTDIVDVCTVFVNGRHMVTDSGLTHLTLAYQEGGQSSDSNKLFKGEIECVSHIPISVILIGHFELIEKSN